MKRVKNNKQDADIWVGQTIQPGSYYEIEQLELIKWQLDSKVLTDIGNGDLVVNDGDQDFTDIAHAVNFLMDGDSEIRDADYALMVRTKMAPLGWTYHGHFFEIKTSQLDSLFDKDEDGTNWSWCSVKFYNASNQEITDQPTADTDCVKTIVDWEPPLDFEVIGGEIRALVSPSEDVRVWVKGAPDIPAAYGGSKSMISGMNFKFINAKEAMHTDGRVSKRMVFNAQDHRGKLRFTFKHPAGTKIEFMTLIEGFKQ